MSLIVLCAGVVLALAFAIPQAMRATVHTVGSCTYVVSRVTGSSLEYRVGSRDVLSWHHRGDVRLYQDGADICAVPLLAECAPSGDLFFFPGVQSRAASADETKLFHEVCDRRVA